MPLVVAGTVAACLLAWGWLAFSAPGATTAGARATVYTALSPLAALFVPDELQTLRQAVSEGGPGPVQQAPGTEAERQASDGRHHVSFDPAGARKLQLYDSFDIQLDAAAGPARGTVEKVTEFEGMKRLSGTLAADGNDSGDLHGQDDGAGGFSITLSADGSYAAGNFTLAGNAYSLESRGGVGWVGKTDSAANALHRADDVLH